MYVPTTDTRTKPGPFYAVGGSLRTDCPSYVERRADRELYDALNHHEFCYILTSRQMGKSSLMIRTVHRLRQEGTRAVVLDLTATGSNLTAEQWYLGLLDRLGEQLGLEDELEAYWEAHRARGPLHRWMGALREVVLTRLSAPLVIFIDEIDAVRSLPFSTDEFFAAIRECYNRRADEERFRSLTFCLLGVAAPSDLIQDTRLTPFNIGHRIELTDFTPQEAAPLAAGLDVREEERAKKEESHADAQHLLSRILYWTDGHPYLTQRLCAAVAETTHNPQSTIGRGPSLLGSVPGSSCS
jgi:hypothetical protein